MTSIYGKKNNQRHYPERRHHENRCQWRGFRPMVLLHSSVTFCYCTVPLFNPDRNENDASGRRMGTKIPIALNPTPCWPPQPPIPLWCKVRLLSLSPYAVSISLASAVIKETAANEKEQAYIIPRPSDNTPVFEIMFHLQTWLH